MEIAKYNRLELELAKLQEYLKSERRRTGKVDEVGLKGTFAETIDSEGIDYGEFGVVREGIASQTYFEFIGVVKPSLAPRCLRSNNSDLHTVSSQILDEREGCAAYSIDWAQGFGG